MTVQTHKTPRVLTIRKSDDENQPCESVTMRKVGVVYETVDTETGSSYFTVNMDQATGIERLIAFPSNEAIELA